MPSPKKSMIDKGGTCFYFLNFWCSSTPPSLAFTSTLYLLNYLMWSSCKCFFIDVLPWIGLYCNNPLHLRMLSLKHEEDTLKKGVRWHKMHLIIYITFTSTTLLAWARRKNAQRELLLWYSTQDIALFASDYHNTFHVTCSSIMCTSSWASTGPYSWDVWEVVGPRYFNVWDAMTSKDSSMVAPISPPFLINISFKVKECDVFHDILVSKHLCNIRKKSSNGTILRLKW